MLKSQLELLRLAQTPAVVFAWSLARLRLILAPTPAAVRAWRVARRPLADARDVRRAARRASL